MANVQITQLKSGNELLILHPETIAEIVNYTDSKVLGATNVQSALDILAQAKTTTESSISTINTNVSNAQSKADSAYSLAGEAKSIAEGRSKAFVFDTLTDMVSELEAAGKNDFNIGDNLLIKQTNVPDYWISEIVDTIEESVTTTTISGTVGPNYTVPGTDDTKYYIGTASGNIGTGYSKVTIKSISPVFAGTSGTVNYDSETGVASVSINHIVNGATITVTLNCYTNSASGMYGYYNISMLETQKVDLTEYQKQTLDSSVTINGETKTTVNDSLTAIANYISGLISGTNVVEKSNQANKLVTARTISLGGDATGSITFDGSANKTLTVTLANSGVTAGTYSVVTVDAKGRATSGGQILEVGGESQTDPSSSLAVGGIFFKVI